MVNRAIAVLLVLVAAPAGIAGGESGGRPDPADPSAPGPAPRYESVFGGYNDGRDRKQADWKEANDEAGRLGGHKGHTDSGHPKARDDRERESPPPSSPGDERAPAPPAHGEHHGH